MYIPLPYGIAQGGTGATTAAGARTNLGIVDSAAVSTLLTSDFTTIAAAAIFAADTTQPLGGLTFAATNVGVGATSVKAYGQTGTSVEWKGALRVDSDDNFVQVGIAIRDSVGGGFKSLTYATAGGVIVAAKWTNLTTYSAAYGGASYTIPATLKAAILSGQMIRLRIRDTGGNNVFQYDLNGDGWVTLYTVANTDHCTADQRMIMADPASTSTANRSGLWCYAFGAST